MKALRRMKQLKRFENGNYSLKNGPMMFSNLQKKIKFDEFIFLPKIEKKIKKIA
jgi:hypothetical protein